LSIQKRRDREIGIFSGRNEWQNAKKRRGGRKRRGGTKNLFGRSPSQGDRFIKSKKSKNWTARGGGLSRGTKVRRIPKKSSGVRGGEGGEKK